MIIEGEPERAPNTREVGKGFYMCICIYIYIFLYVCGVIISVKKELIKILTVCAYEINSYVINYPMINFYKSNFVWSFLLGGYRQTEPLQKMILSVHIDVWQALLITQRQGQNIEKLTTQYLSIYIRLW